ncbi:phosphoribosylanthranilate isomerase [Sphingomonas sp. MAH-20]|uniref:N-(5'-phosphoribosyl)anthranilate isomerase n=1 Tax=Sphingomonas horti TaxID=2682842 RepID=A0A6I4J0Z9_9SPHN|nr:MULTISPECIES: phosphoribosylanthranilate isomerase [Sphingomonas]MBA2919369.1 phosphoribosylanthranilate isomerase [Sphingomonas sp. CGMCC 1.13658]MVO78250.1 phosphoribosylanthranilate isomerase [Sphingomonas horti]
MRVATKICGLSTPETLDAAIAGGASHVGFVFFPQSPRHLTFDLAAGLAACVPARVGRVGVFVDPDDALLAKAIETGRLDALQLHKVRGERAAAIAARFRLPLWIAIAIRTRADLDQGRGWKGIAQRLVYDARTPAGALPGGMGLRFDWKLLDGFSHPLPWALSGGLSPGNVADAIGVTGARMVDVSSGVESAPGVKDVDKIAAFLQAVARS